MTVLEPAGALRHGDHLCAFFQTPAEQRRIANDFVQGGLAAGDRVWCLTDILAPADVLAALSQDGVPAHGAVEKGQLVVRSAEQSYLAELPFDPGRMVAALHRAVDESLADGYAGFRVSGDMAWATRAAPGSERLLEYETRVNEVLSTRPAAAMCEYQRRRFDSTLLTAVGAVHTERLEVDTEAGAEGGPGWSIAALPNGAGLRIDGEADLATRAALHAALSGLNAATVRLRLDGLRFIDVGCLTEIMALARPPRHLALHAPPALMLRMIELMWPGVAVEVRSR